MSREDIDSMLRDAAAIKIFGRRDSLLFEQADVRARLAALIARDRAIDRDIDELRIVAKFYGLEFDALDGDEKFERAKQHVRSLRNRAIDLRAQGHPDSAHYEQLADSTEQHMRETAQFKVERLKRASEKLLLLSSASQSAPQVADIQVHPTTPAQSSKPKVRELVLARLRSIAPVGAKAASVRGHVEMYNNLNLHEKTVGMTLYRLSQEGLAHRKGQTWFYGPQVEQTLPAEPENPGAGAPGQAHDDQ